MLTRRKVLELFDQYVSGFIFTDIERSIGARTNFLTALGLMSYTEFIGGLISGNAGQRGHAQSNFYAAYNRLGSAYVEFDRTVRRRFRGRTTKPRNVYDVIRCGLVHEYFIKKNFVIARRDQRRNAPGLSWSGNKLAMANRNFFSDFKQMCLDYRQQLATDKAVRKHFERAFKRKKYLHP
jgi:hypothetical protein